MTGSAPDGSGPDAPAGHPRSLPEAPLQGLLDAALHDPDPLVRERARGALARSLDDAGVGALLPLLGAPSRAVRERIARVLGDLQPPRVVPRLRDFLATDADDRARAGAVRVLVGFAEGPEEVLGQLLRGGSARLRRAAACSAAPADALRDALDDSEPAVAERALAALHALGETAPVSALQAAIASHVPPPDGFVRALAAADPRGPTTIDAARAGDAGALDAIADETTLRSLLDGPQRVAAAWALVRERAVDEALRAAWMADPDPRLRSAAAHAAPPDEDGLADLAQDPDPSVRWFARRASGGALTAEAAAARCAPHARSADPSARPPYGLRNGAIPEVARVPAAIALCQPRTDRNLGVAVRSAEAAGLREVFLVGRGDLLRGATRGTDRAIPIRCLPDAAALLRRAREAGYQLVAVQQTATSVPYHEADYPPQPLFLLGAEVEGLPALLRRHADLAVEIPLFGAVDSLNVACAATCVLFHWRTRLRS